MLMVGFDLGKRKSWVTIEDSDGKILVDKKVPTTREALAKIFGGIGPCTVLLEASTSSEWVARFLEGLSHTVLVADPNFGPMYAHADKHLKTDRRDAHALLFAVKVGAYRLTVRRSDEDMLIKTLLASRSTLVGNRVKLINRTRATLQRFGIVEESSAPEGYADSVRRDCGSDRLLAALEPSLRALDALTKEIFELDQVLEAEAGKNPIAVRLDRLPGVGRVTALAFVYALSDVKRFPSADAAAAYLGLVPSMNASGEREFRGGITKHGDCVARALLNNAALHIMRSKDPSVRALHDWALALAQRRGGKKKGGNSIARSALARRLARIMFAMWRDGTDFTAERTAPLSIKQEVAAA